MNKKISYIVMAVAVLLGSYFIWQHFHEPQPVTSMSQDQAETPEGVKLAAKNAHIAILQSQLEEAAKQIAELKDQEPVTVIKTVPVEVIKVVEKQVRDSGANFGIVTDPVHPDQPVNLKDIEKLPADTPITLNQYNVFAYRKIIRGLNIYPDWGELAQGNFKLQEFGIDASRRITKDGKYLGAAAAYDVKNKQAKLGLRYAY